MQFLVFEVSPSEIKKYFHEGERVTCRIIERFGNRAIIDLKGFHFVADLSDSIRGSAFRAVIESLGPPIKLKIEKPHNEEIGLKTFSHIRLGNYDIYYSGNIAFTSILTQKFGKLEVIIKVDDIPEILIMTERDAQRKKILRYIDALHLQLKDYNPIIEITCKKQKFNPILFDTVA